MAKTLSPRGFLSKPWILWSNRRGKAAAAEVFHSASSSPGGKFDPVTSLPAVILFGPDKPHIEIRWGCSCKVRIEQILITYLECGAYHVASSRP